MRSHLKYLSQVRLGSTIGEVTFTVIQQYHLQHYEYEIHHKIISEKQWKNLNSGSLRTLENNHSSSIFRKLLHFLKNEINWIFRWKCPTRDDAQHKSLARAQHRARFTKKLSIGTPKNMRGEKSSNTLACRVTHASSQGTLHLRGTIMRDKRNAKKISQGLYFVDVGVQCALSSAYCYVNCKKSWRGQRGTVNSRKNPIGREITNRNSLK